MQLDEALALAAAAIADFVPGAAPPVALNPEATDREAHVFRAALAAGGSLIAKVADPGRLAAQFDRLQQAYPRMKQGLYRVPEPHHHDAARGVVLMEDAWGMSAASIWAGDGRLGPTRVLTAAGGWLARYHRTGAVLAAFNPDPHLNWLNGQIDLHRTGQRRIPRFDDLLAQMEGLQASADRARGAKSLRAVTHRDFHAGNLLIRKQGRAYGIDMENTARDEAMRDALSFLTDLLRQETDSPHIPAPAEAARRLIQAYGRPLADPAAAQFFQTCFALNLWAGLDEGPQPLSRRRALTLRAAEILLKSGNLLAPPP